MATWPGVTAPRPVPALVLVLAAGVCVLWSRQAIAHSTTNLTRRVVPAEVKIDGALFVGEDLPSGPRTAIILETDDYLHRRFANSDKNRFLS